MTSNEYESCSVNSDIDLLMECYDDELSSAQIQSLEKANRAFINVNKYISSLVHKGPRVYDGENIVAFKLNLCSNIESRTKISTNCNNGQNQQDTICPISYNTDPLHQESENDLRLKNTSIVDLQPGNSTTCTASPINLSQNCENINATPTVKECRKVDSPYSSSITQIIIRESDQHSVNKRMHWNLLFTAKPCNIFSDGRNVLIDETTLDEHLSYIMTLTSDDFKSWLVERGLVKYNKRVKSREQTSGRKLGLSCDGSIFELSRCSPKVFVQLLYYWSNQTDVIVTITSLKLSIMHLNSLYSSVRGVCVAAIHEDSLMLLGGKNQMVEVGFIKLCVKVENSTTFTTNIYILGVLDSDNKRIRLLSIKPEDVKKNSTLLFGPLCKFVDKRSTILSDLHTNKDLFTKVGFQYVFQRPIKDQRNNKEYSNTTIVNYLKTCLPPIFARALPRRVTYSKIQPILDELCWREIWGATPLRAFHSIIEDIKTQTQLKSSTPLPHRLSKITEHPFLDWDYSSWETNFKNLNLDNIDKSIDRVISNSTNITDNEDNLISSLTSNKNILNPTNINEPINKEIRLNRTNVAANQERLIPSRTANKNILNPTNIKTVKYKIIKGNKVLMSRSKTIPTDVVASSIDSRPTSNQHQIIETNVKADQMKPNVVAKRDSPMSKKNKKRVINELVALEEYFYGQIPGIPSTASEKQCKLQMNCVLCDRVMNTNTSAMNHIMQHILHNSRSLGAQTDYCKYCLKPIRINNNPYGCSGNHCFGNQSTITRRKTICLICEMNFKNHTQLIVHMHMTHSEMDLPYECGICQYRSSQHYRVVNHFYEKHSFGDKIQCPLCLKIVALKKDGITITRNLYFFFTHLQKHFLANLTNKCNRCVLSFINEGLLVHHLRNQHNTRKYVPNIERYLSGSVLMPKPTSPVIITMKRTQLLEYFNTFFRYSELNIKIDLGEHKNALCCECENYMSYENHFLGEYTCLKCTFKTCCEQAMWEHVKNHTSCKGNTGNRPLVLDNRVFCSCGCNTIFGNKLACHLIDCGKTSCFL